MNRPVQNNKNISFCVLILKEHSSRNKEILWHLASLVMREYERSGSCSQHKWV